MDTNEILFYIVLVGLIGIILFVFYALIEFIIILRFIRKIIKNTEDKINRVNIYRYGMLTSLFTTLLSVVIKLRKGVKQYDEG